MSATIPQLAQHLLDAGIPVVVCKPRAGWNVGDLASDVIPPAGWNTITVQQARRDIKSYRPGIDTLAMIGGHGVDLVDIDAKVGGSLDDVPSELRGYGLTRTPGGGWHIPVPSTGYGKGVLTIAGKHVGDYVGGTRGGGARLLGYLSGSSRPKYAGVDYQEVEPWDIERLLEDEPSDVLLDLLGASELSREASAGKGKATSAEVERFLERHSEVRECEYAETTLRKLLEESLDAAGTPRGRHGWCVRAMARVAGLMQAECLDARAYNVIADRLHEIKPEGGTSPLSAFAWAIANTEAETDCLIHHGTNVTVDKFWESMPQLARVRDYALGEMKDPLLMFLALMGLVTACVPGKSWSIAPGVGEPAPISLMLVNVGRSGAGKSGTVLAARRYLGLQDDDPDTVMVSNLAKPQALKDVYLRDEIDPVTNRREVRSSGAQIMWYCDELGAFFAAEGSEAMMGTLGTLRSMWSGMTVSDVNVDAERRRHIPGGSVGVSLLLSLLEHNAGLLLTEDEQSNGTMYRYVFAPAGTVYLSDEHPRVEPLAAWWVCSEGEVYDRHRAGSNVPVTGGKIRFSEDTLAWVRAEHMRTINREHADGDPTARQPHEVLNILKLASGIAGLCGQLPEVSDECVNAARLFMDIVSGPTQNRLLEQMRERQREIRTAKAKGRAEDEAVTTERGLELFFAYRLQKVRAKGGVITRNQWREGANANKKLGLSKKQVRDLWEDLVAYATTHGWTRESFEPDGGGPAGERLVMG